MTKAKRSYVTLVFRSSFEREAFMGQLSDGWGENYCGLAWSGDFDESTEFRVSLNDEDLKRARKIRAHLKTLKVKVGE